MHTDKHTNTHRYTHTEIDEYTQMHRLNHIFSNQNETNKFGIRISIYLQREDWLEKTLLQV